MPSVLLLGLSALAGASALQLPLLSTSHDQAPIANTKKPLVSSSALQDDIKAASLLKRSEHLFEIAKLGEDEYNHPTRVIGSKGMLRCFDVSYTMFIPSLRSRCNH